MERKNLLDELAIRYLQADAMANTDTLMAEAYRDVANKTYRRLTAEFTARELAIAGVPLA